MIAFSILYGTYHVGRTRRNGNREAKYCKYPTEDISYKSTTEKNVLFDSYLEILAAYVVLRTMMTNANSGKGR